jgi:hypothetical protein
MDKFIPPDFQKGEVELRIEKDNEIAIYGSVDGLKKIAELINHLIGNPKVGHVHLGDYEILTKNSLKGVIAIFDQ